MAREIQRLYNGGYVTARDRALLAPNELQLATGIYYKPGDPTRAHKLPGRTEFGDTTTAAKVSGIAIAQFDSGGTDYLLALSSGKLYGATPGVTGSPALLYTLTGSGTTLDAAHANDRWYLAMGSENRVLESNGTVRVMGMQAPSAPMTLATQNAGAVNAVPNANDSGWTSMALAYDADLDTASYAVRSTAGATVGIWSFAAGTGTNRKAMILWSLDTNAQWSDEWLGAVVTVKLELSQDSGGAYTEIINLKTGKIQEKQWASAAILDATNLSTVKIRATLTYTLGTKTITANIHHIKVIDSGASAGTSATNLIYSYTEFAEPTLYDPGGESVPAPVVQTGAFTTKASVRLTMPSAATNSRATHRIIYRNADNGSIQQIGKLAVIPVAQTVFEDDFTLWSEDEQPEPLVNYISFTSQEDLQPIRIPRDGAPPNLRRVVYFKGGLVGLTSVNPRAAYYSAKGFPESWPALYVIDAFPLEEHDELVDLIEVGGSIIFAAKGAMIRLDEVPHVAAGLFIAAEPTQIKGAPGCVGDYAMTVVNYGGQSHAAWISPENGILVTDGHRWDSISDDLDWSAFDGIDKSAWVLTYYKHLRILRMDYSTTDGGGNDRYYFFHLDKIHMKERGQAKLSGPHYGKAACVVVGQVSNTTRVYTGHWSDGSIYLEEKAGTGTDASLAYDASGTWPLIVQSPRRYDADFASFAAIDGRLYHTDFGTGQTVSLAYTVGRDASSQSSTRTKTVSLASQKGTQFDLGLAGEWHEELLTHTGTGLGAIGSVTVRARVQGQEGKQRVVA